MKLVNMIIFPEGGSCSNFPQYMIRGQEEKSRNPVRIIKLQHTGMSVITCNIKKSLYVQAFFFRYLISVGPSFLLYKL